MEKYEDKMTEVLKAFISDLAYSVVDPSSDMKAATDKPRLSKDTIKQTIEEIKRAYECSIVDKKN